MIAVDMKPCLACGSETEIRILPDVGREAYVCTRYPACKGVEPLPEHVRMRRVGAPVLPGFDL